MLLLALAGAVFACKENYKGKNAITEEDLAHHARTLSDDAFRGRDSGTIHSERSAFYIADAYYYAGLLPAFGNDYTQRFDFNAGMQIEPGTVIEWRPSNSAATEALTGDVLPIPLSQPGRTAGDLVFGGYCIRAPEAGYDDITGRDLQNKVVLCLRYAPGGGPDDETVELPRQYMAFRHKAEALRKAGAVGVIFLGKEGTEPPDVTAMFVSHHSRPMTVFAPFADFAQRIDWLREEQKRGDEGKPLTKIGTQLGRAEIETAYRLRTREAHNVGAVLRPIQQNQKWIIVGGHHDHIGMGGVNSLGRARGIHNGADDNASGTSIIMEVAMAMHAHEQAGETSAAQTANEEFAARTLPDEYNVLFLHFDAEELGLFGSSHFVKSDFFKQHGENVVAMINLDMVGRLRAERGLTVQGYETADGRFRTAIDNAFSQANFPDGIDLKHLRGGAGPSDHSSFYHRSIPVAFLFTGGHPEYHTPEDDFPLLNISGMFHIALMTYNMVHNIAETTPTLAYRRAPNEPRRAEFHFDVRLGIRPGYHNDGRGVLVEGIVDGAPIKNTGIKPGDRIIRIGETDITNIHDLTAFLSRASIDRAYTVVWMRDDDRMEAETRLMSR